MILVHQDQKARGEWIQCSGMPCARTGPPTECRDDRKRRGTCRLVDQRDPDLAERERTRAFQEGDQGFAAIRARQGAQLARWVREHYCLVE